MQHVWCIMGFPPPLNCSAVVYSACLTTSVSCPTRFGVLHFYKPVVEFEYFIGVCTVLSMGSEQGNFVIETV